MTTYPAPPEETARRLEWQFLPPGVRAWIERKCDSPVVRADSCNSGFTPGFASVLTCQDGSKHFVKAANTVAQRLFADSYREEARKLAALPPSVPAPRLKWVLDDDWVVLGIEHVDATTVARPWTSTALDDALDALEVVARELTPAPAGLTLDPLAADFGPFAEHWPEVRSLRPDLIQADEAENLARSAAAVLVGDTVVHTDVRADNVLLDDSGPAWICDWNWLTTGPDWVDSVMLLIGARGDGLDVVPALASRPLLRDVPDEHVDALLALLTGFFFAMGAQPSPPTSPWLRAHQTWQGEVCWQWLAERRGWS